MCSDSLSVFERAQWQEESQWVGAAYSANTPAYDIVANSTHDFSAQSNGEQCGHSLHADEPQTATYAESVVLADWQIAITKIKELV